VSQVITPDWIQLRRYGGRPSGLIEFELKELAEMRPVYRHQPKSLRADIRGTEGNGQYKIPNRRIEGDQCGLRF
jgi:hypothetical protein